MVGTSPVLSVVACHGRPGYPQTVASRVAIRTTAAVAWRPDDPGLSSLRRAARVALILPPGLALALLVLRDVQLATFFAFGCFAFLVMADFGGPRRPRATAYATTALIGAVLVALGTLVSPIPWLAALGMFVVAFSVQLVSVFGSYAAAAQSALLLSFVLAVSIPAAPAVVGSRLAGWLIASAVATLAAVFLWPRFERQKWRHTAAVACRAVADLIARHWRAGQADLATDRQLARQAVDAARSEYAAAAKRPAGPTRRDRAFVELLTELEATLRLADQSLGQRVASIRPCLEESDRLATVLVQTLRASAGVLEGGAPPDLLALDRARAAHRQALDNWSAEALRADRPPEEVLEGLEADYPLRVLSYAALALGSNAIVAAGGSPTEELRLPAGTPNQGIRWVLIRIVRTFRSHLVPTSSVLQSSLRAAFGLTFAVLLAQGLQLSHAFWVVLGTASVLRTNALSTGRTTIEALAGTLAGFALGAVFTVVVGTNALVLWASLPAIVFLAAYASSAIGFIVGQAAFTINVLILFNLITPAGWRLGLARIEDVAIGAGISVLAGLLLWPRGARRALAHAVAGFYRAVVSFLSTSFTRAIEGGPYDQARRDRRLATRARDRANEAFEQYLNERGAKPLDPETGAFLIAAGSLAIMSGDLLNITADMRYQAGDCPDGARTVRREAQMTVATLAQLADRLENEETPPPPATSWVDDHLRNAILSCLRGWREDPRQGRAAIAVFSISEQIRRLRALSVDLEEPVAKAGRAARVPWWR